ncbi:MAG: acyltransferase family protein, partial [Chthoniobacterales bacterium]
FVLVVAMLPSLFASGFGTTPWKAYAATLLYLANWVRAFSDNPGVLGILGVTWSLAIEEQFYLLWPPVLALSLRLGASRVRVLVGLAFAVAAIALWRTWLAKHGVSGQRINNGFDTRADALLIGCALGFAPLTGLNVPINQRQLLRCSSIAATIFILTYFFAQIGGLFYFGAGIPLVSLSTAAIIAAEATRVRVPVVTRLLEMQWLRWIGRISYSIYLWHLVAYSIKLPVPELFNISFSVAALGNARNVNISTLWMTRMFGAIAIGALSFYGIERPFLRLKRRFASARQMSSNKSPDTRR